MRVEARIGLSLFRTSIFPDSERQAYVLPLKRAVRHAEKIADGGFVNVWLEILDV